MTVYHGIKMTSKAHRERGISCVKCHSRIVHGPEGRYQNTPTMETCRSSGCHDGEAASDECNVCHITLGTKAPVAFDSEWVDEHKADVEHNEDTCTDCHSQNYCDSCHSSARPHKNDWLKRHDEEAQKGEERCNTCHIDRFCTNCHEIKKKHSLDWLDIHASEAEDKIESCEVCHKDDFCIDCHG